ncbi:MAG: entericidin A/B family lipoprotein [Betaproteobacteria bacterium]|jgi:predicted small secreted protein|nr:entericidin A/B family lipoprotein [Betaproteobacteria bacterium]
MNVRLLSLAVLAAFGLALAGCNTVAGVGKDVEKVGGKIQDAATKKSKDKEDKPQ